MFGDFDPRGGPKEKLAVEGIDGSVGVDDREEFRCEQALEFRFGVGFGFG